ncbi:hypothetical protein [Nocardia blacklockiae]|uniref:hypothetical protein n=1 Tax=Nocardia blacklockiae TaxID=480036 RepID=UPI001893BD99|nr:hypothetical protein [Nocardia blacklockiae]MBF6174528.1 hypothetical protein [Nocardia blacklockiae]
MPPLALPRIALPARSLRGPGTVALLVIALLVAAFTVVSPAHAAGEVRVSPGMSIRTAGQVCSVGMTGHIGPDKYAITAGHCFERGAQVRDGNGRHLGSYEFGVPDGEVDDLGFAMVRLADNVVVSAKTDEVAITAVDSDPKVGQKVCKLGSRTGKTCGTISSVSDTNLRTTFPVDHGDSGGIVYSPTSYGMALFVGIVVGTGSDFTLVEPAVRLGDQIQRRGPDRSESFRWYVAG